MEFERPESFYGYCIFSDDVRQELFNKLTFVGVFYGSEMSVFGTLPANIGKFCIHAVFKQRAAEGIESLVFEVHLPGDDPDKPSARIEANREQLIAGAPPPDPENDDPFFQVATAIVLNPLELRQEGNILVSVIRDGRRYKLGKLKVRTIPAPAQEPPTEMVS